MVSTQLLLLAFDVVHLSLYVAGECFSLYLCSRIFSVVSSQEKSLIVLMKERKITNDLCCHLGDVLLNSILKI